MGEELYGGKVLKILVVGNDIDWNIGTFEIISPDMESFENGEKFFVMDIVVQFRVGKGI